MDGLGSIDTRDFERSNQREMDRSLAVRFEYRPRPDKVATLAEGRPVYKDVLYIDIRSPGDRDPVVRPASPRDIDRFRDHYNAFMNRTKGPSDEGTPLAEWPLATRSMVEELAYFNVKTVEQLRDMSDANAQQFQGMHALRAKARAWLERAKDESEKAVIAEQAATIAELKEALRSVQQQINNITPPPPEKKKVKAGKVKAKAQANGSEHGSYTDG